MGLTRIPAGRFAHSIDLKSVGTTLDAYGEPNHQNYTDVARVKAQLVRLRPEEKFSAGADRSGNVVKFRIRYRTDITNDNVFEWRNDIYEITGVEPEGRLDCEYLMLTAERVKAA